MQPARATVLAATLVLGGCATGARVQPPAAPLPATTGPVLTDDAAYAAALGEHARQLLEEGRRHTLAELTPRNLDHESLWSALRPLVDSAAGLHLTTIGRSVEGRALYAVEFGQGPVRVVLWSQMHGNEPTATLALADLLRYLVANRSHPEVRRLHERLTVAVIPMLNPDGAQRRRRENAQGIDLNRDARRQRAPESRALAAVHARLSPHFGFNLHDQSERVTEDGRRVAISLLAPAHDPDNSSLLTSRRAEQLAAVMRLAADPLVDGRVTRYDESYNESAFGNAMQSWGTSTVLLETGSWEDDPDKQHLRHVNFAMLLAALDAIASGALERAPLRAYESLSVSRPAGSR